jgi:hypothetical protein
MAEQLRVMADGEHVVVVAAGEQGQCEIRLKTDEAERFHALFSKAYAKAWRAYEARLSKEATRVNGVEDDGDPGQGVAE